ncbi:MAG: glycosyltransferase family 1 protein [Myxococcales bacterium]|nr:glycosyltransferase family 1 protein [Myxococcales bacterium]
MRFCDVSSFYSDHGGGVRTYHRHKLEWFARHPEHRYVLVVPGERPSRERLPGGTIVRVRGLPVTPGGTYRQIVDLPAVRRVLREGFDVVESGSPYLDGWIALAAARGTSARVTAFCHADVPDAYVAPAAARLPRPLAAGLVEGARRYLRALYGRLDAVCVASRYMERKLRSYGVTNLLHTPLGVDPLRFHPDRRDRLVRRDLGAADGDRLVLFVGRFHPEKELGPVLDAVRRLDGRPRLRFALVGGGPQAAEVRAALSSCRSAKVLDYVSDPERVADLYAAADLYLAPGPHETFGLAVLEALASGLPVVAVDHGAAGEIVTEAGAGALFRRGDGADLAARIAELLDADLGLLSRRARRIAERSYTWDHAFARQTAACAVLCGLPSPAARTPAPRGACGYAANPTRTPMRASKSSVGSRLVVPRTPARTFPDSRASRVGAGADSPAITEQVTGPTPVGSVTRAT